MTRLDTEPVTYRPPVRRRTAQMLVFAVALLVVVVAAAAVVQMWPGGGGSDDHEGAGTGSVSVTVTAGQSAAQIGKVLADAGVVKTQEAFVDAARDDERSVGIQPGAYELKSRMSAAAALEALLDPRTRLTSRVVIPEGTRVSETLALVADATKLPLAELTAASRNATQLGLPADAGGNPEGYLFPATYTFPLDVTADGSLQAMITRFNQEAESLNLTGRASDLDMTPDDVVTVASLVQAESGIAADDGKVAAVVYNRLARAMKLQFDSTVNYARGTSDIRLSEQDSRFESPYNTYLHVGLPPGPINSPGRAALEAALDPPEGDWLYFVKADKDGSSFFTADYEEFLRAKAKAQADGVY